jgi:cytidylate kinase
VANNGAGDPGIPNQAFFRHTRSEEGDSPAQRGHVMNIVTISRQVGSLGDVIAAIVARKMGFKLIGQDQILERANTCDSEYRDACSLYESERGPGFFERIFFDSPSYTSLFQALTYEFASQRNVVLIGRGAQLMLREVPGVFGLRVAAPVQLRVERIGERFGISAADAAEYVRKHDRERKVLLQSIFDKDLMDWSLYDMVLNTAHYASEGASDVVCRAIEKMEKVPQPEDLQEKLLAMGMAKRLETTIKKRLTPAVAFHVVVDGEPGGKVTLSGRIRDKKNKEKAGQIAEGFPEVTSVDNNLKVTELSFSF